MIADFFKQSVFKQSFERLFDCYPPDSNPSGIFLFLSSYPLDANQLMMGFSATLEVLTSKDYKISGAIGPCVSLQKKGPCVGDMEIGEVCLSLSLYCPSMVPIVGTWAVWTPIPPSASTLRSVRVRMLL